MEGFHLPLKVLSGAILALAIALALCLGCHESLLLIPEPGADSEPTQAWAAVLILVMLCCLAGAECGECL